MCAHLSVPQRRLLPLWILLRPQIWLCTRFRAWFRLVWKQGHVWTLCHHQRRSSVPEFAPKIASVEFRWAWPCANEESVQEERPSASTLPLTLSPKSSSRVKSKRASSLPCRSKNPDLDVSYMTALRRARSRCLQQARSCCEVKGLGLEGSSFGVQLHCWFAYSKRP